MFQRSLSYMEILIKGYTQIQYTYYLVELLNAC